MEKQNLMYEGKAKKVYETGNPELLIVSYKDDATAFNGLKKGTIAGKGIINNKMSNLLMQKLETVGVPTHFVEELNDRETVVKRVKILPLEVISSISSTVFAAWKRLKSMLLLSMNNSKHFGQLAALLWLISKSNLASFQMERLCLLMKLVLIPAAFGTAKQEKNWTRIDFAAILAV